MIKAVLSDCGVENVLLLFEPSCAIGRVSNAALLLIQPLLEHLLQHFHVTQSTLP
jgi:hypothetical protein